MVLKFVKISFKRICNSSKGNESDKHQKIEDCQKIENFEVYIYLSEEEEINGSKSYFFKEFQQSI